MTTALPALPGSLLGYWLGCTPVVVRGALVTAGHLAGYDGTKRLAKRHYPKSDGPVLHVCAAITAAFCAATLSAPADVLQTRIQTVGSGSPSSMLSAALALRNDEGVVGFFRGWRISTARMVPTFIVGSMVYEQMRKALGLSYLS